MKLKLDENLGKSAATIFRNAGHDTATIAEEGLKGAQDSKIIEMCKAEARCLVTLDMDFGNPFFLS